MKASKKIVDEQVVIPVQEEAKKTDSNDYITLDMKSLSSSWALVLSVTIFTVGMGLAIFFGLKLRPIVINTTAPTAAAPSTDTFAATDFGEVSVGIGKNSPVKGSAKAKVTIMEFGDYICPYCQKFFTDSFPTIKKDYMDANKVKMIYREYPLSIHDSGAAEASLIGICLYQKSGANVFNAYHDLMYANPTSYVATIKDKDAVKLMLGRVGYNAQELASFETNWGGAAYMLDQAKMKTLLGQLKQNYKTMLDCSYKASTVAKLRADKNDFEALNKIAVEKGYEPNGIGTPAFVIGIVDKNGTLNGRLISGAYPVAAFKAVIDEMLAK